MSRRRIATSRNPVFNVEKFKARKIPPLYEALHPTPSTLLHWSLSSLLPLKMAPQGHMYEQVSTYERTRTKRLPYGHHLLYFHPGFADKDLMSDGTDMLHAPDGSWKYRLWAGGTMEWPSQTALRMNGGMCMLSERIADIKLKEDNGKAFVKIERRVHQVSKDRVARLRQSTPNGDSEEQKLLSRVPDILETRWLCFTRDSPFANETGTKTIEPPADPYYERTMTATPSLLFRFSALTFNAHKIHVDPEFARNEYGLPNIVVHGPLTIILMTTILRTALNKRMFDHKLAVPKRFVEIPGIATEFVKLEYKNMAPIYAGEEMTIACKPLEPSLNIQEVLDAMNQEYISETWQIWIEKKHNGKTTVAASCTATLRSKQPEEWKTGTMYGTTNRSAQRATASAN